MPEQRPELLAQKNFKKHRERLEAMNELRDRFEYIYEANLWGCDESHSGLGSTLQETRVLRRELPTLLAAIQARSILDIPCGDFRWMSHIDFSGIFYLGADIVSTIVASNQQRFGSPERQFLKLDITANPLPQADVVLCRDCLVHLSYANIERAIENIRRSGAKWLLMTHFGRLESNSDISDGDWRPLNFLRPPFSFPEAHTIIVEECLEADGAYADKALGLWTVADLP